MDGAKKDYIRENMSRRRWRKREGGRGGGVEGGKMLSLTLEEEE